MSSRSESLLNHIGDCIRAQTTIKQNRQRMKQQSRGRWRRWHGSGDSDRDGDGNDNGDGNGYGKGDSGNNNGNSGDDCVDGDDGDLGDDGGGGVSGDGVGNSCGNTLSRLPLVNDVTFVMTTFLTRPTTSMRCPASERGHPPTTDSIRCRIDDDNVG